MTRLCRKAELPNEPQAAFSADNTTPIPQCSEITMGEKTNEMYRHPTATKGEE